MDQISKSSSSESLGSLMIVVPLLSLFLRQGVGWLEELRGFLVSLWERRADFLQSIPPIISVDPYLPEGRSCNKRCSQDSRGSGFKFPVGIIVGVSGGRKGT